MATLFFSLLDISVDLFKVGGGVILMICAISLAWGKEKEKKFRSCGKFDPSISVVPLAIPMAVGPGAIVGLVVVGSEHVNTMMNYVSDVGSLLVGVVVLGGVLSLGVWSDRVISKTAISIITRLTGLFVAAIAAKMILEGIRNYWNGF